MGIFETMAYMATHNMDITRYDTLQSAEIFNKGRDGKIAMCTTATSVQQLGGIAGPQTHIPVLFVVNADQYQATEAKLKEAATAANSDAIAAINTLSDADRLSLVAGWLKADPAILEMTKSVVAAQPQDAGAGVLPEELHQKWTAKIRQLHNDAEADGVTLLTATCAAEAAGMSVTGSSQDAVIALASLLCKMPEDVVATAMKAAIDYRQQKASKDEDELREGIEASGGCPTCGALNEEECICDRIDMMADCELCGCPPPTHALRCPNDRSVLAEYRANGFD